jgi:transglutaminase-like putative cysteine protease
MKIAHVLLILVLLASHAALAAEKIQSDRSHYFVAPVPAWVHPGEVPASVDKEKMAGQSVRYRLVDRQVRIGPKDETNYRHYAFTLLNEDGLADNANIQIEFNPAYEALTIHSIDILRDDRRIDKLHGSDIKLIQRETDIERRLYDGALTAFVALDDVRIGDTVEYAYSIKGSNPVFGNKHFSSYSLGWTVPVDRVVVRVLTAPERKLHWHVYNIDLKPKESRVDGYRELIWQVDNEPPLSPEGENPRWYRPNPWLQLTEYKDWTQVVAWAQDLYRYNGTLQAELHDKVNSWKGLEHSVAAAKALLFVQQQVRYFGVELGQNSHKPHDPNEVYRNRYGDCKDKALLLSALLRNLDIQAYPALVSTEYGKAVADWMPSPGLFDHVIVAAQIDGQRYWLDPTRSYQTGPLDSMDYPDYGYALPVDPAIRKPEPITPPKNAVPTIDVEERFTVESYEKPVRSYVKTIYTGEQAENQRYYFSNSTRDEIGRKYLNYYARRHPGITAAGPVRMHDDKKHNRVLVEESYRIPRFLKRHGDKLYFDLSGSTIDDYTDLPRTVARTTPLGVKYPIRIRHRSVVVFPEDINFDGMDEEVSVEDGAVIYERVVSHGERSLSIEHRYRSKRDAVMPKALPEHLDHLRKINDELYYSAWVHVPEDMGKLVDTLLQRLKEYDR